MNLSSPIGREILDSLRKNEFLADYVSAMFV